jgi:hypothetical protein
MINIPKPNLVTKDDKVNIAILEKDRSSFCISEKTLLTKASRVSESIILFK